MPDIVIYTDGACSGNPGPGGWGAIVALPEGQVRELGAGAPKTTNNRMELLAAIAALEAVAERLEPAIVHTDSTYMIHGVTKWLAGWKRKGWTSSTGEPVANRDLWERLDALAQARSGRLHWRYVRGHSGSPGNERCDEIAVGFSRQQPVSLYDGPAVGYEHDLASPRVEALPERPGGTLAARGAGAGRGRTGADGSGRGGAAKKGPSFYLSLLDGRLERHATWAECQARVHGRNARFKKVSGPDEEAATLRAWGLA